MRVALFSSTADITNGYGNITAEYCRELTKAGIGFTLFLPAAEKKFHEKFMSEVPADFSLPPYIFEMKNPKAIAYLKTVDVSGYDIVHSLLDFPYCFIAARSAKKYKKPFIMGSQGTYGVVPLLRFPDRLALEYSYASAKKIVVPSQFTRTIILKHTKKVYPIDIIHNGVNFSRFDRQFDVSDIRAQYPGKMIYLTVGGLKERKGQDLVFEALAKLKSSFKDFVYILVGEGGYKTVLEAKAKELGVLDHVVFAGSKSGDELVQYFYACDIYVHTPKVVNYNFEGFGIVYLEAGACGKPVVATDAGGVSDAVLNGKTGYIVADGDTDAIADRLLLLSQDETIRARFGAAGKEYAKQHDWATIVRRFIKIYKDILHV